MGRESEPQLSPEVGQALPVRLRWGCDILAMLPGRGTRKDILRKPVRLQSGLGRADDKETDNEGQEEDMAT